MAEFLSSAALNPGSIGPTLPPDPIQLKIEFTRLTMKM
ncbi:exosporium leader peptide-containing protein [Bacillus wiedmannii]|nr:Protein of unknown function [Bacillus wiedmannii]